MEEIHDFDDTVIASLDEQSAGDAIQSLSDAGYELEVLRGERGKEHLDPAGETSPGATLKRLVSAFGDQYRVLDRLNDELDLGNVVISVAAKPDEAAEAVRLLQDHGGDLMWKFGTWTFTRVGSEPT